MPNLLSPCLDRKSELKDSMSPQERHKALLDLGEAVVITLEGILFGEYRNRGEIVESIERGLYNCATRAPSLGVHWGFVRDLSKYLDDSILGSALSTKIKSQSAGNAVFYFKRLKESILNPDKSLRINNDFEQTIAERYKGQTPSTASFTDFFNNVFIASRNMFAHPDQMIKKTGELVHWPLTDEYYDFINPILECALTDLMNALTSLDDYTYGKVMSMNCVDGNVVYGIELPPGTIPSSLTLTIGEDEGTGTDVDFVVSLPDESIYVQNYRQVPTVSPEISEKIVRDEKKKQTKPLLESIIRECLGNDGEIDAAEMFTLKLTAQAGYFSPEDLTELIGDCRVKLDLPREFTVAESHATGSNPPRFNPWWMYYLTLRDYIEDSSSVEKGGADLVGSRTFAHRKMFEEVHSYLTHMVDSTLNKDAEGTWQVESNKWQQGKLTGYIWNRISQSCSPIGSAVSIVVYMAANRPEAGDSSAYLRIGHEFDRDRLQEIITAMDPDMSLIKAYSDSMKEFIQSNRDELQNIEDKHGEVNVFLSPKYILDKAQLRHNVLSLGYHFPAIRKSVKELLDDKEDLFENFEITRFILPYLLIEDVSDNTINVDAWFKQGLNILSVPIQKITDFAIEKGLGLSDARRRNQIYQAGLESRTLRFQEVISDLQAQDDIGPLDMDEVLRHADEIGLRYSEMGPLLPSDSAKAYNHDPESIEGLDRADQLLDNILPGFKAIFPGSKLKLDKTGPRQTHLTKEGKYGLLMQADGWSLSFFVGLVWFTDSRCQVISRLIFNKGYDEELNAFITLFAGKNKAKWELVENEGEPRYTADEGGTWGGLQTVYPVTWSPSGEDSSAEISNMLNSALADLEGLMATRDLAGIYQRVTQASNA